MSLSAADRAELQQRLTERLAGLQEQAEEARDSAAPVELDQSRQGRLSRMDAMQAQAMSQAAIERLTHQIAATRRALSRIDQAEFGLCIDCAEPIKTARLLVDPGATRCIACAEAAEAG